MIIRSDVRNTLLETSYHSETAKRLLAFESSKDAALKKKIASEFKWEIHDLYLRNYSSEDRATIGESIISAEILELEETENVEDSFFWMCEIRNNLHELRGYWPRDAIDYCVYHAVETVGKKAKELPVEYQPVAMEQASYYIIHSYQDDTIGVKSPIAAFVFGIEDVQRCIEPEISNPKGQKAQAEIDKLMNNFASMYSSHVRKASKNKYELI